MRNRRRLVWLLVVLTTLLVPAARAAAQTPAATTLPATDVVTDAATLHGTFDAGVAPPAIGLVYAFEWGDSASYGFTLSGEPGEALESIVPVSAALTGLAPGTTYHYRLVVTDTATGDVYAGTDQAFTTPTPGPAPAATALTPRNVTRTSATLRGLVDPNGADTTVTFALTDHDPTPAVAVGAGTGPVPVTFDVADLRPQTRYAYTVVATNEHGTTSSAPVRFTTAPVPLPSATTGVATGVSATGATLWGSVGPPEVATEYRFDVRRAGAPAVTAFPQPDATAAAEDVFAEATGLDPGVPYEFRVVATNQSGSSAGEWVPFATLAAAPDAVTGEAKAVTPTSATLQAVVNPHGAETTVAFELEGRGTTAGAGVGAGAAPTGVERTVDGLNPSTTYRFRVLATNAEGTTAGAFVAVTTAPAPPSTAFGVATGDATALSGRSARVAGTVAPRAFVVAYAFAYGETTAYGRRTAVKQALASASPQTVQDTLTGLVPGRTYHYQLVAAGPAGQAFGGDRTLVAGGAAPLARVTPRRVSVKLQPARDRRPPFRYRVSGRVGLPAGMSGGANACGGRVRVVVRQGRRVRGSATVRVRRSCRYAVRVEAGGVVGRRGRLAVAVRFLGSPRLRAWSAPARTVRFG